MDTAQGRSPGHVSDIFQLASCLQQATGDAGWSEMERHFAALAQSLFFTVLLHDVRSGLLLRVYSNREDIQGVGGLKRAEGAWATQVISEGSIFRASGPAALTQAFANASRLLALGFTKALNIPVRCHGETLGVLNLIADSACPMDTWPEATCRAYAQLALGPCLLEHQRWRSELDAAQAGAASPV
jgi:hypothetical protein